MPAPQETPAGKAPRNVPGNNFPGGTLNDFYPAHRHDGSIAGGGVLHGPYLIFDKQDGRTYEIICTNGVLGTRRVQ